MDKKFAIAKFRFFFSFLDNIYYIAVKCDFEKALCTVLEL